MCGICGQLNYANPSPVASRNVEKMAQLISHRGPDDSGFYCSGSIGLGFRRLSIIDIRGGHQPMADREETVWVVFNGEIYNYPELKRELQKNGHEFRTRSDTEVIVHGYKQWGTNVLDHLNGMFGLAIWDERNRRLMLARDRMGIKPLYYRIHNGSCYFASELRSLLATMDGRPDVDPLAMNLFLRYRYTPAPLTVFKGIKKLYPGSRIIVENHEVVHERWWNFHPKPFDPMPDAAEAEEELLSIYTRALRRHLLSDVPLGILLSGGLDSNLLLALMNQFGDAWKSFTVGFGNTAKNDELEAAVFSARILRSDHHSTQLTQNIFDETLSRTVSVLEEPVATPSIVPMYHVCKRAREDVKVVLMGQGPDELFAGYKRHLGVYYGNLWRHVPAIPRNILKRGLARLPRNETVKRALYSLDEPDRCRRYQKVFSLLPGDHVDLLFQDGLLPEACDDTLLHLWSDMFPLMDDLDELGGLQFLEIRSALPDELLMYADKLSMAHSLEVRVPYLDLEIVEFVERLNASFKIRNFQRKWLHRRVCKRYLPEEIIERKKIGFEVPVDAWFRQSCSNKLHDRLLDKNALIYRYLQPDRVSNILSDHRSGKSDHSKILFSLTVLEEWMQTYIGTA